MSITHSTYCQCGQQIMFSSPLPPLLPSFTPPPPCMYGNAGVVFTILAATGTFPASIDVMKARNTYALTIAKYILYALSGAGAYLAAKSARSSLRNGRPTTVAKGILELSAAGVLASAVMTVASMVISSQDSHSTPVWVYIIQVVVGVPGGIQQQVPVHAQQLWPAG